MKREGGCISCTRERGGERGRFNPLHYACLVSVYMTVYTSVRLLVQLA